MARGFAEGHKKTIQFAEKGFVSQLRRKAYQSKSATRAAQKAYPICQKRIGFS
jgi:hypothetical protein